MPCGAENCHRSIDHKAQDHVSHLKCEHHTHIECLPDEPMDKDYDYCKRCQNGTPTPVASSSVVVDGEPSLPGGKRRLFDPVDEQQSSQFGIPLLKTLYKDQGPRKSEEEILLEESIPMERIFSEKRKGLDHFIAAGIKADVFCKNGYGWKNAFSKFRYCNATADLITRQKAFERLELDARTFRDFPGLMNLPDVLADLKIENRIEFIRDVLKLEFPDRGALQCNGDMNWTGMDCARLGLKMADLYELGLSLPEQFHDLMVVGMSDSQRKQAWKALGVTDKDVEQLSAPPKEPEVVAVTRMAAPSSSPPPAFLEKKKKKKTKIPTPPTTPVVEHIEEEEEEQDEEIVLASPPRPPQVLPKVPVTAPPPARTELHDKIAAEMKVFERQLALRKQLM